MRRVVRVFVPDDLLADARRQPENERCRLLGWTHGHASTREVLIVVAGLGARTQPGQSCSGPRIVKQVDRVPALQDIGALLASGAADGQDVKGKSKAVGDGPSVHPSRIRLVLVYDKPKRSSRRHTSTRHLHIRHLSIDSGNLQPEETTLQLYSYRKPRPESLQYLSLHHYPPTPQGALSDDSALLTGGHTSGQATRTAPATQAQAELEHSVRSDPARSSMVDRDGDETFGSSLRITLDLMNEASASIDSYGSSSAQQRGFELRWLTSSRGSPAFIRQAPTALYGLVLRMIVLVLTAARNVLDHRIQLTFQSTSKFGLSDLFSTTQQLSTRLDQLLTWPIVSHKLRTLRLTRAYPTYALSSPYMSVWNGIWLIINDLILGHAAGTFLRANSHALAELLSTSLDRWTVQHVLVLLGWLSDWPAGLKLNTEMARFFSALYSGTAQLWSEHVLIGWGLGSVPTLARIIDCIGLGGQWGGLTLILALCADALWVGTLHIHISYLVSRAIYAWFLYGIDILFQVFRGKKRNALQGGRVDVAEYELDQRLLGTIFFTILVFLFPTVAVYYLPFALAEWMRLGVRAGVLEVGLALLNQLPLFGLMLRLKDPARVPVGVELVSDELDDGRLDDEEEGGLARKDGRAETSFITARYRLRSVPASLGQIFHGQAVHFSSTRQMPALLLSIVTGRRIEVDYAAQGRRRGHGSASAGGV
ncbi:hypothetical protein V8E36_005456 [Tilletia maclaganii]